MGLTRGNDIKTPYALALLNQFNELHTIRPKTDKQIELALLKEKETIIKTGYIKRDEVDFPTFSPSSIDKCKRELFLKFKNYPKDGVTNIPYQSRWLRNSTLVHEGVQKDLLYMEKFCKNPRLLLKKTDTGLNAWEENIKTVKTFEHKSYKLAIVGMMDGILQDVKTGKEIGFEFKTKSNSVAQVGNYKMKTVFETHAKQCIAYSLLFGIEDFVMMYEAVAKDQWYKGTDAKTDVRTFDLQVTEDMKLELLDRLAEICESIERDKAPAKESNKCLFCQYKQACQNLEGGKTC